MISGRYDMRVTDTPDPRSLASLKARGMNPEETWFYSRGRNPFTGVLDEYVHFPADIQEVNENVAKGSAAHEAGHILITRMGDFVPEAVMKEIGFGSLLASCEERPTDMVVKKNFKGAGAWVSEMRRELRTDGDVASSIIEDCGYLPKMQQLGNLIVFGPYHKKIPKFYDKDVLKLFVKLHKKLHKMEHTLPEINSSDSEEVRERKAVQKSKERYRQVYQDIWPEVQVLLEADQKKARLKEMMTDVMSGTSPDPIGEMGLSKKMEREMRKMMEKMRKDKEVTEEDMRKHRLLFVLIKSLYNEIAKSEEADADLHETIDVNTKEEGSDDDPYDVIEEAERSVRDSLIKKLHDVVYDEKNEENDDADVKENIKELIENLKERNKARQEVHTVEQQLSETELPSDLEEQLKQAVDELIKRLTEEKQKPGSGDKPNEEKSKDGDGGGDDKDKKPEEGGEGGDDKDKKTEEGGDGGDDETDDEFEKMLKDLLGDRDEDKGKKEDHLPMDKMSEELLKALQSMFDRLSPARKQEFADKADDKMKKVDDLMSKMFSGGLNDEHNPDNHAERASRGPAEGTPSQKELDEAAQKKEETDKKIAEMTERMEQKLKDMEADRNAYEIVYDELREEDTALYRRLESIFHPSVQDTKILRATGSKLNLPAVYRMKAAMGGGSTNVPTKIFESTHKPEKMDYTFTILVDLSGSMDHGGKIEETFKAVILMTENLNRLGIRFEILGFQDKLIPFKSFDQKVDDKVRAHIAGMPFEVNNTNPGGHNVANYNDDGPCIWEAAEGLNRQSGENKFLLVWSDGNPASYKSNKFDLYKAIEMISKKMPGINLIGSGLGMGTEHVADFYPIAIPNIKVTQLAKVFGDLLQDIILHPTKYQGVLDDDFKKKMEAEKQKGGGLYFSDEGKIMTPAELVEQRRVYEEKRRLEAERLGS